MDRSDPEICSSRIFKKLKNFHIMGFAFSTFPKQNDAIHRKHPSPRSCVSGDQFLPFIMYPTPLCLVGLFGTGCS